ncbi:hypothetical protein ACIA8K_28800 [Catenuloplanes sp. NPDC051500]|uniref:hypothetical protein n=1 Tax=Catenuloplanes sp. NPDC051500 TaxID=3363959 RepID=UPI00379553F5
MATNDDERQTLADALRGLPAPELVDVLRRVLAVHDDELNDMTRKLVLAEATRYGETLPRTADDPAVSLEVVAWPDRDYYDGGFGPEPGLYEQGYCARCEIELTSTAKQAFCPICGSLCRLT